MSVARPRKRLRLSTGSSSAKRLALRLAFKGARSVVRSRMSRRSVKDSPALTFQNDNRWTYRRRPAPRSVKRFMRRKFRFINKIVDSKLPFSLHRFFWTFSRANAVGQQIYFFVPMYTGYTPSISGTVGSYDYFRSTSLLQLNRIFEASRQSTVGPSKEQKLQFDNATIDLTINADGSNQDVAIVDVYHIWARKDSSSAIDEAYVSGIVNKQVPPPDPTNTTSITSTALHSTPFDSSVFCRLFLIKSKREFRISPGNNITLQLRDRKEYTISTEDYLPNYVSSTNLVWNTIIQKYTEGYAVFYRGAPRPNVSAAAVTLNCQVTVNYRYRIMSQSIPHAVFTTGYT